MWIIGIERGYYPEITEYKTEEEAWEDWRDMGKPEEDETYYLAYVVRRKLK